MSALASAGRSALQRSQNVPPATASPAGPPSQQGAKNSSPGASPSSALGAAGARVLQQRGGSASYGYGFSSPSSAQPTGSSGAQNHHTAQQRKAGGKESGSQQAAARQAANHSRAGSEESHRGGTQSPHRKKGSFQEPLAREPRDARQRSHELLCNIGLAFVINLLCPKAGLADW